MSGHAAHMQHPGEPVLHATPKECSPHGVRLVSDAMRGPWLPLFYLTNNATIFNDMDSKK